MLLCRPGRWPVCCVASPASEAARQACRAFPVMLPVYPQVCGKAVDILWVFSIVFHSPKSSLFWLFGSYPGFPPHYGYSC